MIICSMSMRRRVWLVILLLITVGWMAFIFYMSARPAVESSNMSEGIGTWVARLLRPDYRDVPEEEWAAYVDVIHSVVRKVAHFTEYALLGILLAVDSWLWSKRRSKLGRILLYSWLLGTAYAVSDEIHQLFIEGRSGEIMDVLIDSGGCLVGVAVVGIVFYIHGRGCKHGNYNELSL